MAVEAPSLGFFGVQQAPDRGLRELFHRLFHQFLLVFGYHFFQFRLQFLDLPFLIVDGGEQRVKLLVVHRVGELRLHAVDEIAQHVHVVVEGIVWRLVGAELAVHRPVEKVLG